MTCPAETSSSSNHQPAIRPFSRSQSRRKCRPRGGEAPSSNGGDGGDGGNLFGLTRPGSTSNVCSSITGNSDGRGSTSFEEWGSSSDKSLTLGERGGNSSSIQEWGSASFSAFNFTAGRDISSAPSPSAVINRRASSSPPRAFSDTAVCLKKSSSSSSLAPYLDPLKNLPRTNATFSLVQRSGAPLMREIIASIDRKTEAAGVAAAARRRQTIGASKDEPTASSSSASVDPPRAELTAMANSSRDAYYRVIAGSSGGIPSVVRAMKAFADDHETQASGCAALASICVKNASNQSSAGQGGALSAVLAAMAKFPNSVAVQGAGCDALDALTSMTPRNVEMLMRDGRWNFEAIVEGALGRFLPPSCREGAEAVLRRAAALR